ncbi:type I secretion system permease/ATPase [Pseudooceanicola onchidii]|uniref:type I secretion system permease/ATPase n=1 Tax=Pseudooceanicola onchidii TaxID=2562279 RepID=UPI001F0E9A4F|nr:type I secretion system permease/ATPase [Pseudooceanicola onchidii]
MPTQAGVQKPVVAAQVKSPPAAPQVATATAPTTDASASSQQKADAAAVQATDAARKPDPVEAKASTTPDPATGDAVAAPTPPKSNAATAAEKPAPATPSQTKVGGTATAGQAASGAPVQPKADAAKPTQPTAQATPSQAKSPAEAPTEAKGPAPAEAPVGADKVEARSTGGGMGETIEGSSGPVMRRNDGPPPAGGGGGKPPPPKFHKRKGPQDFEESLRVGSVAVRRNLFIVMIMTLATNLLILSIPIYLFQISDRVLTSRSTDTLIMLTVIIVGAVILQTCFDALRRFILMRTAVEVAVRLGAPILSAAAHASLHGTGREYQTLGDLQQLRGFLTSGTLLAFLDVPFAPLFVLAIFMVHPHLGSIVVVSALLLAVVAYVNQRLTHKPFSEANKTQSRANGHLESMARNSQIINALAMIPEAVTIWGRDTAASLTAQVRAQDRNIVMSAVSRAVRLLTQVGMLGWGAHLAIDGQITGGMVIAASIIAGRALAPIEGAIEGWNGFILARQAYDRIRNLLVNSKLQFEKLNLPQPEGRLDVERLLYVPTGTKHVVLNGVSFSLNPGESLAVIGNSGAGKTTLGKMLVGSVLPTSGNVRLDLMDLRNWDPRQFGENIGYLPQDVQLFPGTIKDNIGRMRRDATDEQIYRAAKLADVHEMIANLPHGYETYVQADGFPLSGGQKQRIALARAFYGDPRFVVLDEPNSNLDTKGDKALAQALQHAQKSGITVVVITQKPSLLSVVDKIMLLADGSVQMFGERTPILQELAGRKAPQQQTRMQGPAGGPAPLPNGGGNG